MWLDQIEEKLTLVVKPFLSFAICWELLDTIEHSELKSSRDLDDRRLYRYMYIY